jgi:uncharacterized protein (TIGR03435 family)
MDRFIGMIVPQVGRPIIDKTNLTGTYDVDLKFAPQTAAAPTATFDTTPEPGGPSIFTALTEQLGLRLESSKGPIDVLVIDSVQKPSEN